MSFAASRFAESGYHPTSVAEIVEGLGVGKGVFYWYFASKEDLFVEILREAQLDLRRYQQRFIADEADPVGRIELGIRATMEWSAANSDLLLLVQFAATEERFAEALRHGREVAVGDAIRHVKEGIVEGSIDDTDPVVLAHAIIGVATQLSWTLVHEQRADPEGVADAAVSFCRYGLLGQR